VGRGGREGKDEARGYHAKRRSAAHCLLKRGEKEKERTKVHASGPDTDRFSRSRDINEEKREGRERERERGGKEKERGKR